MPRCLNPSNIFLDEDASLKVDNFGLASPLVDAVDEADRKTGSESRCSFFSHLQKSSFRSGTARTAGLRTKVYAPLEQMAETDYGCKVSKWALSLLTIDLFPRVERVMKLFEILQTDLRGQMPAELKKQFPGVAIFVESAFNTTRPSVRLQGNCMQTLRLLVRVETCNFYVLQIHSQWQSLTLKDYSMLFATPRKTSAVLCFPAGHSLFLLQWKPWRCLSQ